MRAFATFIAAFSLILCSCQLEPGSKVDNRKELAKIPGPEVGAVGSSLKIQAEQAFAGGDYVHAAGLYKQLLDKDPDNKDYSVALADALRRGGDNKGAIKVADDFLKKDPTNAGILEVKGLSLMNLGEFSDASKVFGDVMKYDPKRWRTLNGIGILFAMKNMNTEALAYYQEALNQNPDNATVLNNVGLTLAMDKQYDKSIEAFEHAKKHLSSTSPEIKRIDLNMALVYAIDGKLDMAEQVATPHLSKAALYNNMGFYAYLAKNNDLAKSYLNMALTQSTTYYERAWKNLGALSGGANNDGTSTPQNGGELKAPPAAAVDTIPPVAVAPAKKPAKPKPVKPVQKAAPKDNLLTIPEPTNKSDGMVGTKLENIPATPGQEQQ